MKSERFLVKISHSSFKKAVKSFFVFKTWFSAIIHACASRWNPSTAVHSFFKEIWNKSLHKPPPMLKMKQQCFKRYRRFIQRIALELCNVHFRWKHLRHEKYSNNFDYGCGEWCRFLEWLMITAHSEEKRIVIAVGLAVDAMHKYTLESRQKDCNRAQSSNHTE